MLEFFTIDSVDKFRLFRHLSIIMNNFVTVEEGDHWSIFERFLNRISVGVSDTDGITISKKITINYHDRNYQTMGSVILLPSNSRNV